MATRTERDRPNFLKNLVDARGVPKIFNDLSSVKFSSTDNKKNLRLLLSTYATWGRTIGPGFEFEEFVIKLEKFSGNSSVRNMIETLRRGEEYSYTANAKTNTTTANNNEDAEPEDITFSQHSDNFDDIDLDQVIELEQRNETNKASAMTQDDIERMENNRLQALQRRQGASDGTAPTTGFFSSRFAALAPSNDKPMDDVTPSNGSEISADASNDSELVDAHNADDESEILADNHPSIESEVLVDNSSNDSEPAVASSDIVPDR